MRSRPAEACRGEGPISALATTALPAVTLEATLPLAGCEPKTALQRKENATLHLRHQCQATKVQVDGSE